MTTIQIIISIVLSIAVLIGISMMSKVRTSTNGNLLSALAMLVGVVATLLYSGVLTAWTIYPAIIIGALIVPHSKSYCLCVWRRVYQPR